jgi:formate dehydrogenase subunit gamma
MSSNTVVRHGTDLRGDEIVRYTFVERVCHWIAGFSYLYVLATGLALFTPYLYWLAYVLGGGPTIRFWHPWVGLVFVASTLWMHKLWGDAMKTTPDDLKWRQTVKGYITNNDAEVAPAGQFNSGQKQFYWIMFYGGLLLLLTGIVMWFPELMPRNFHWVLPIVVFLHCVGALATIAGFIIHVYMGIFFVKGGLHGILFGRVPAAWVRAHHRLWYEKVIKEDRSRVSSTSIKGDR